MKSKIFLGLVLVGYVFVFFMCLIRVMPWWEALVFELVFCLLAHK